MAGDSCLVVSCGVRLAEVALSEFRTPLLLPVDLSLNSQILENHAVTPSLAAYLSLVSDPYSLLDSRLCPSVQQNA